VSLTDPIADLLTRIRNAQRAGLEQIDLPGSKIKQRICEVLRDEASSARSRPRRRPAGVLTVVLSTTPTSARRSARSGASRSQACAATFRTATSRVMNGLGVAVLSTSGA